MNKLVKKIKKISSTLLALCVLQPHFSEASTLRIESLDIGTQYRDNPTDPNVEDDGQIEDGCFEYRVKTRVSLDIDKNLSIKTQASTRPEDGLQQDGDYHAPESAQDLSFALQRIWMHFETDDLTIKAGAFSAQEGLGVLKAPIDERFTMLGISAHIKNLSKKYGEEIEVRAGNIDLRGNNNLFDEEDITEKEPNYIDVTFKGKLAKHILVQGGVIHYKEMEMTDHEGNPVEASENDPLEELVSRNDNGNYSHLGASVPIATLILSKDSPVKASIYDNMVSRFDEEQETFNNKTVDVDQYVMYTEGIEVKFGDRLKGRASVMRANPHDPLAYLYEVYEDHFAGQTIPLQGSDEKAEFEEGALAPSISTKEFLMRELYPLYKEKKQKDKEKK